MTFSENEKKGIAELLLNEENTPTLIQLARGLIKNITEISSGEEKAQPKTLLINWTSTFLPTRTFKHESGQLFSDALNIVFTHAGDSYTLLNKKSLTKEILFKYLNKHHVPIELNVTKAMLIAKILDYWKDTSQKESKNCDIPSTVEKAPPANVIAKAFAEWFFGKFNQNDLVEVDFWPDAHLQLRIIANDATEENITNGAKDTLIMLMEKKAQFGFYFNLNVNETGVQGRMDVHGMMLVLTCGTLHTPDMCVGVFECLFELLRDPFDSNNWKIKTLRCVLRSQESAQMPTLDESESLKEALAITEDLR